MVSHLAIQREYPKASPSIRRYRTGEEKALFEIYYSAIHLVARRDYSPEQIQAWAPQYLNTAVWENHMRVINPFVAELHGQLVGYADLQSNGYIDHFFVSGHHPRLGIGTSLMRHVLARAAEQEMTELTANVSLTAQPFFEKFGFVIVAERQTKVRGVVIPNALMRRICT